MPKRVFNTFFLTIVLPALLVILLFVISVSTIIIPTYEKGIMEKKREMIKELTNVAWSVLSESKDKHSEGLLSIEEAKLTASKEIEQMRYGSGRKDYFWIIDMQPVMVMHPYRTELNNSDLSEYKDPLGKKLFVEAVELVEKNGEGYFDYIWQWKDDSTQLVPKLTFVKVFKPWGWIVGTGVYLDDVNKEVAVMKKKLWFVSLLISLFISLVLFYIIRKS